MPSTRHRALAVLIGGAAALGLGAAPAAAITCPPGVYTGDPAIDYCQSVPVPFSTVILGDGPTAYFRLGEASGVDTITDTSGNGYTGGFKNRTQSGPIGISGDGNTARDFFGGDGYGFINGIPAPGLDNGYLSYTMEAYFYLRDTDSLPLIHNDATIMQFGGAGAVYIKSNTLRFRNGPDDEIFLPTIFSDDTWYMVVAQKSGGDLKLWFRPSPSKTVPTGFDPSPDATGTSDYLPGGKPTFYIGYGSWAPWFNGALDEVSYFSTALTNSQIALHFYADPVPDKGMERVVPHSADSSNPRPSGSPSKPSADRSRAAKLKKAKAEVKRLAGAVKKAKRWVGSLKHHYAPLKTVKLAQKKLASLEKQLKRARARVKSLS